MLKFATLFSPLGGMRIPIHPWYVIEVTFYLSLSPTITPMMLELPIYKLCNKMSKESQLA